MSIDFSSPIVKIAAIATAATVTIGCLGYGIYKGIKYRKVTKQMSEIQAKVDEASKAVTEAENN